MKSAVNILAFICFAALLASCTPPVTPSVIESSAIDQSDAVPPPIKSSTDEASVPGENIRATLVHYGKKLMPVAVFAAGDSLAVYHDRMSG